MIDPKAIRDAVARASARTAPVDAATAMAETATAVTSTSNATAAPSTAASDSRPISILTRKPVIVQPGFDPIAEPGGWPEMVPFKRPVVPPLPLDLFPAWHRRMIEAASTETETAPDLAASVLLAAVATAVQRKFKIEQRPGFLLVNNIWTLALLASGGRKSRVFSLVTAPISAYQRRRAEALAVQIALDESKRRRLVLALAAAEKPPSAKQSKNPDFAPANADELAEELAAFVPARAPLLFVDEGTPEALEELITEQGGRMALLSDEAGAIEALTRYSDSTPNISSLLKAHDGGDYSIQRKRRADGTGGSRYQPHALVTFGLSIQPESYFALLCAHAAYTEKGFSGRFLHVLVPDTLGTRKHNTPSTPEAVKNEYSLNMEELLALPTPPGLEFPIIRMSPEATEALLAFEREHEARLAEDGELGKLRSWGSKLTSNLCRIVALFHFSENRSSPTAQVVSLETMNRALGLARYYIAHAQAVAFEVGADEATKLARRALNWIQTSNKLTFTKRDLQRAVAKRDTVSVLSAPLTMLSERNFIRALAVGEQSGRPSEAYEVNPSLLEGK